MGSGWCWNFRKQNLEVDLQVVSHLTFKAECIPEVGINLVHLSRPSLSKEFVAAQLNRTQGQLLVCRAPTITSCVHVDSTWLSPGLVPPTTLTYSQRVSGQSLLSLC